MAKADGSCGLGKWAWPDENRLHDSPLLLTRVLTAPPVGATTPGSTKMDECLLGEWSGPLGPDSFMRRF